jgi:hypothetical protein
MLLLQQPLLLPLLNHQRQSLQLLPQWLQPWQP